jgi:hypothetical protein
MLIWSQKMDWTQTFTIIFSVVGSMIAVWYAFYHIVKEDIKRHDIEIKEMRQEFVTVRQEMKEEFKNVRQEMKEEFGKVHTMWADLLKQIYEIKLDQSRKA